MEGGGHALQQGNFLVSQGEVGGAAVEEFAGVAAEGDDGHVVGEGRSAELSRGRDDLGRTRGRIESGEGVVKGGLESGFLVGDVLEVHVLLAFIHVETGVLQAVQQGYGVGAVDVAGAGTAGDEGIGGAAEDGDILDILERQGVRPVLEQDHAFEGALAGHGGVGLEVGLVGVGIALHLRAAEHQVQDALDAGVEFGLGQGTVLDGGHDLLILQVGARLEHVVAGAHLGSGVVTAVPVGHHGAFVTPFIAEDGGYEVLALGGIGAVDLVVGGHDGPRVGFLDGDLEALEVDLTLGAGADDRVVAGAVGLLVVVGEVLDGGTDIVLLDTADIGGGRLAGDDRVFGIVFEVTAVQRVAVDVQGRGQEHVGAVFMDFLTDGLADVLDEFLVPGGGEEGSDREMGAVVGRVVTLAGRVDAKAGRAVR